MSSWTAPEHRGQNSVLADFVPYYSDTHLVVQNGLLPVLDDKTIVHLEEMADGLYEIKDTGIFVAAKQYNWDECVRTSISLGTDDLILPMQTEKKLFCIEGIWLDYRSDFDREGEERKAERSRFNPPDLREALYGKAIEVDGRSVTMKTRDDQIHGYGFNDNGRANGWSVILEHDNEESIFLHRQEEKALRILREKRKKALAKIFNQQG